MSECGVGPALRLRVSAQMGFTGAVMAFPTTATT